MTALVISDLLCNTTSERCFNSIFIDVQRLQDAVRDARAGLLSIRRCCEK